jgi:hypothetical protein
MAAGDSRISSGCMLRRSIAQNGSRYLFLKGKSVIDAISIEILIKVTRCF